jgi:transposase
VRATTAFNKMLAIPGAHVTAVAFTPEGVVVDLGRRAKRLHCPCGWSTRAVYDRSRRSWRGLDLGATKVILRAEIRRLSCRRCGRVRTEEVPWARPGAPLKRLQSTQVRAERPRALSDRWEPGRSGARARMHRATTSIRGRSG